MQIRYTRNIFAYELAQFIEQHGPHPGKASALPPDKEIKLLKEILSGLTRSPFSLPREKVHPLVASLSLSPSSKNLPALNHDEILGIIYGLQLDRLKQLPILAALIAVGVQRTMLTYVSDEHDQISERDYERAWGIATEVRKLALEWLVRRSAWDDTLRGLPSVDMIPTAPVEEEELSELLTGPLAEALGPYYEGVALVALGKFDTDEEQERILFEQAQPCLRRAKRALELLPKSIRDEKDWKYWYEEVQKELAAVEKELGELDE